MIIAVVPTKITMMTMMMTSLDDPQLLICGELGGLGRLAQLVPIRREHKEQFNKYKIRN